MLNGLWDGFADLVLGARCAGCGRPGFGPCVDCAALLAAERPESVRTAADAPVVAAGEYAGVLRELLLAAKERSALGLIPTLGERLAVALEALLSPPATTRQVILLPVPSTRQRVAERGLDFTAALARDAARRVRREGRSVSVAAGLRLVRQPRDQSELDHDQRRANLQGAFRLRPGVPEGRLVVVDDIVTTGATLAEAGRALRVAGRPMWGAAVVAQARKRNGAPDPMVGRPCC